MSIYTNALFSKTQQHVLALLFGQPQRSFYTNEIINLADSGTGGVQRELARLEAAALVTVKRIGNQKHYQANSNAPIFNELRSIVMKSFGAADLVQQALAPLWSFIDLAFIFGSIAKGTEHAGSDLDVMVVGSMSNNHLLKVLLPLSEQLGRKINPTLYTINEFNQRIQDGKSFMMRVLEQPKIMIKGTEDDIAQINSTGKLG